MKPVDRICTVCGRSYKADSDRLRFGRQTTCSRGCSYKARAAKLCKLTALICPVCGKQFERCPSHIKSKHEGVYCSRRCHYVGRTLGTTKRVVLQSYRPAIAYDRTASGKKAWATRIRLGHDRHSKATCERLRIATAEFIARTPGRHISKIEDKVAKELRRIGLAFTRQATIRDPKTGRFCGLVDFLIGDRTVLEVNGTFWHSDPRTFPNGPIFPAQRRTAERYARKIESLSALRYDIHEVWEADLNKGVEDAVRYSLTPTRAR